MTRRILLLMGGLALAAVAQQTAPPKTHLKVGDTAPDFTIARGANTTGKDIHLADYRGKKVVVLAFFPAAFTGG